MKQIIMLCINSLTNSRGIYSFSTIKKDIVQFIILWENYELPIKKVEIEFFFFLIYRRYQNSEL